MYRSLLGTVVTLTVAMVLCIGPTQATAKVNNAEKKIVLQISDGGAKKQTLVLNVANNLIKHYGLDNVKLEIVAFGPGLRLLFEDNTNKTRIQSLSASGVQFAACQNTTHKMTKILGHKPDLSEFAMPVKAGVARIIELTEQGYTLIRP
ncbi:MAG: hypothetical protein BMS9Abin33_0690 [Gammaproteobacteria bacterium]|nr:MAG: hypothetical protein BMS9Abin33_0690 [Gammaproteobacteria bacterium]